MLRHCVLKCDVYILWHIKQWLIFFLVQYYITSECVRVNVDVLKILKLHQLKIYFLYGINLNMDITFLLKHDTVIVYEDNPTLACCKHVFGYPNVIQVHSSINLKKIYNVNVSPYKDINIQACWSLDCVDDFF